MSETQLQIVLSLQDDATAQLQDAQAALGQLGQAGTEAATQITEALTPAEEAIAVQAQQAAEAWSGVADDIGTSFTDALPTVQSALGDLAADNAAAAEQVLAQWQAEGDALADTLAAAINEADAPAVAAATKVGNDAGAAAGMGFGGYFKKMIVGYLAEQLGSFLSGGIDSAVAAAQKTNDQVSTLTDQIGQQKASIAENEAALQKWTGTTAEVNAAHEKAAANIAAEKTKIQELQQQLATLQTQQQGLPGQITDIENATLDWLGAHKQLEDSLQTFMTTLGPLLSLLGYVLIGLTLLQVAGSVLASMLGVVLVGSAALFAVAVLGLISSFVLLWMAIENLFNNWGTFIANCKLFWTSLSNLFDEGVNDISNILSGWGKDITNIWDGIWNGIKTFFDTFWKGLQTDIQAGINFIEGLLTSLLSFASNITGKVLAPIQAIANVAAPILSALGGSIGGAFNSAIKAFATGGIVTGPTLAMVGEAGPEAIIPLSAFAGGGSLAGAGGFGGGGNIVINIASLVGTDTQSANKFASQLATSLNRQIKLRNYY